MTMSEDDANAKFEHEIAKALYENACKAVEAAHTARSACKWACLASVTAALASLVQAVFG